MPVYADNAFAYLRAGWRGVLWLRAGTKWPPPKGYTGHDGVWPSPADIQTWSEEHPAANICIRLPEDVIGLDVDAHSDKPGAHTLTDLENNLGALPLTIISTARSDGVSGIRLYRCPPHSSWPNQAGDGIEMIHFGHRYTVAWPSTHPEGGTYRWIDQRTGEALTRPPRPDELPELPAVWVTHLQEHAGSVADKSDVDNNQVTVWLGKLRKGDPCDKVTTALSSALEAFETASRHETMVKASARLIGYGAWGHAGCGPTLTRLHQEFVALATAPGEAQRTAKEAAAEWRRAVVGAVAMHHDNHPEPAQQCSCPLPAFDPNVENAFWKARPALTHIRQFARARRSSPWAVLAVVLTRLVVAIPPTYVLPAIIGGQASLNLFAGIVAPSGGGKGAAEAAAADAVDVGDIHTVGVGSGEGVMHQYVKYVPPNKKDGTPGGIVQYNTAVLFTAGEVDTLGALHNRQASTLLSELRKVYMGEELSFAYVDAYKRLKVKQHAYRAGLIVGIQPARGGVLLDDTDGGTPQRFLWMPGTDPDMPDTPPDEPEPLTWKLPVSALHSPNGNVVLPVCETARETIDREHIKRNRGDGDALDGHALLTRLKWAAALALLDERVEVGEDDWSLAGIVMEMSDHTRKQVVKELRARKSAENTAKGIADAQRDVIREETVVEAAVKRVCRVVMRKLDGGEMPHAKLRKAVTYRDRGYFDSAIDRLIEAGQIVAVEEGRSTTYRTAGRAA